jgi:hypothetical protein
MALVDQPIELVERFTEVAMSDPLSAVLLTLGALLTGVTMAVGGGLVAGALLDAITPPRPGRTHPERD